MKLLFFFFMLFKIVFICFDNMLIRQLILLLEDIVFHLHEIEIKILQFQDLMIL